MTSKKQILDKCLKILADRIDRTKRLIGEVQSAVNEESKSSMGDKYETGRAMLHLEKEKYLLQLSEATKLKEALARIDISKKSRTIHQGSIIITDYGKFFLAVGLGPVNINKSEYYVISPASPLGKEFSGKKEGDKISLNERSYRIMEVH